MRTRFSVLTSVALALAAAGCGGASSVNRFSCDLTVAGMHTCTDSSWTGSYSTTALSSACTQSGGTAGSSCTTSGAVGGCTASSNAGNASLTTTTWYFDGTASTLMLACAGRWSTGSTPPSSTGSTTGGNMTHGLVSCDTGSGLQQSCEDTAWSGGPDLTSSLETQCLSSHSTPGSGCSQVGVVGGCKVNIGSGGVTESTTLWYYSGDAATLMAACNGPNDTWIPAPVQTLDCKAPNSTGCAEITWSGSQTVADETTLCTSQLMGTVVSSCSHGIGGCRLTATDGSIITIWYASGDAATYMQSCTSASTPGTWVNP